MTGRKIDLEAETDSTHREILAMLPNGLLALDDTVSYTHLRAHET